MCGFSPDGSHIVAGSNDCHIYAWFWDIAAAADKGKAAAKQAFYNVVSQQDAARNLEPAAAIDLEAADWPEAQEVCRLGGHVNDVVLLQFSHDGQSVATGSKDGTMRVTLLPCLNVLVFSHCSAKWYLFACVQLNKTQKALALLSCPACLYFARNPGLNLMKTAAP